MTLEEILKLPPGWKATHFPATVELTGPWPHPRVCIPVPYQPQSPDWWRQQAAEAIRKSTDKK